MKIAMVDFALFIAGAFISGTLVHLFWVLRLREMKLDSVERVFNKSIVIEPDWSSLCECGHQKYEHFTGSSYCCGSWPTGKDSVRRPCSCAEFTNTTGVGAS